MLPVPAKPTFVPDPMEPAPMEQELDPEPNESPEAPDAEGLLRQAIARELSRVDIRALRDSAAGLSERYRAGLAAAVPGMRGERERLAYLAVRAPATYAVMDRVLGDLRDEGSPLHGVRSLLEVGCGPGVASWAAVDHGPNIERVTWVDRDGDLLDLALALAKEHPHRPLGTARAIEHGELESLEVEPHDLVLASYVLTEVERERIPAVIERLWESTTRLLVLVEPGSRAGFGAIREAHRVMRAAGARVLYPCTHTCACPMPGDDWCHFSQRLQRSPLHRKVKDSTLDYEDEKFSALVVGRVGDSPSGARIVTRPRIRKGHGILRLCAEGGLEDVTLSKRDKGSWRAARKARWGDLWAPGERG